MRTTSNKPNMSYQGTLFPSHSRRIPEITHPSKRYVVFCSKFTNKQ